MRALMMYAPFLAVAGLIVIVFAARLKKAQAGGSALSRFVQCPGCANKIALAGASPAEYRCSRCQRVLRIGELPPVSD